MLEEEELQIVCTFIVVCVHMGDDGKYFTLT